MFLVILTLFSLAGISFTSSLHKRGGGHNVPLINCPSCQHHICDMSNTIQCEVCQIIIPHQGQPPQDVKCAQIGHCHEDHHHFCCNTEACVDSMAHCPVCHEGYCDFVYRDTCHMCKIDLHSGQLPHVHCLKPNEHCNENHNTLCCNDESCIARAFGQYYPGTPSTYPTTASSSRNTSTTNHIINQQSIQCMYPVLYVVRAFVILPEVTPFAQDACTIRTRKPPPVLSCDPHGQCHYSLCDKCDYHIKHISLPPELKCIQQDNCIDGANVLCCRTEQCIIGAYEPYFKTFRSSTTLPTTAGIPGHTEVNSSNPITFKHTSVVTQPSISNGSTPTLPSLTTTTSTISPSASPFFPSSIGANTTEATTPLTPNGTTGFVSSATIVSSSTDIPSNCSDSITNCATLKGYGVCHAIPEQRDMYDIAFLRCRQTCNLCTEVYKPLVDTTTTPRPSIHCQVCGDYNKDIPCDTRSIYIGPTVSCSGNNNYCMTDIVHSHSNVRVFKRCVNETVCRNQWLSQTSDQDHCTNYGHVPVSGDYTCHFCCTSNKCNQGLLPDSSTLYSKS
ncbi:uncharacterized protein LOC133173537 [Saccostrea echinata]|uniref:uncharacterized protein LOC133173537 n=1 Tax=Saccostrea echinata TaxID=191078 RepID=UPI002A813D37|nr:uncharacterized protein LOC133173537 [Saccostrea echinata]